MRVAPDFEQLVDAHYAALYRFGLSLARHEAEAADLTQQTFYLWATKGHQLRDGAQARTWLFTTLYRLFLGGRRKEERFEQVDLESVEHELSCEPEPLPAQFTGAMVLQALGELDPTYRAPITLFYLKDFSYRQIAEVLEIPQGTVMSRLSRGKAELRRALIAMEKRGTIIAPPQFARESR